MLVLATLVLVSILVLAWLLVVTLVLALFSVGAEVLWSLVPLVLVTLPASAITSKRCYIFKATVRSP